MQPAASRRPSSSYREEQLCPNRTRGAHAFLKALLIVVVSGCSGVSGDPSPRPIDREVLTHLDEPAGVDPSPPVVPDEDPPATSEPPGDGSSPAATPPPFGFWDEGFIRGTVRTAYDARDEGTATNPLQILPCLYQQPDPIFIDPPGCNAGPSVYAQSNAWTNAPAWPTDNYWLLLMNNEPAFNTCNSGPPDASLPRSLPGEGVMGFTALDGHAHLVLNNSLPNPCGSSIPFLSIGSWQSRGNGGRPILALHPSGDAPSVVHFVEKLWDVNVVDGDVGASYLWAVTDWPRANGVSVPRMLFIKLGSWSRIPSWEVTRTHRHWAWPIAEDPLSPGADIAFLGAEEARQFCGLDVPTLYDDDDLEEGREVTYDIDLSVAYDCASRLGLFDEPIPNRSNIPVRGVFWANEVARPGSWVWTSVRDMRTVQAACGSACAPGEQCTRSGCRCGDGPACGPGRYCAEDFQCYARPVLAGDPMCADLGTAHPAPSYLARYTVQGRPGAQVQKYNLHAGCVGSVTSLAPESPLVIGPAGYVTFTLPLDAAIDDCTHPILGTWESWAVVDGIATNTMSTTYFNSRCPETATCELGQGTCP